MIYELSIYYLEFTNYLQRPYTLSYKTFLPIRIVSTGDTVQDVTLTTSL